MRAQSQATAGQDSAKTDTGWQLGGAFINALAYERVDYQEDGADRFYEASGFGSGAARLGFLSLAAGDHTEFDGSRSASATSRAEAEFFDTLIPRSSTLAAGTLVLLRIGCARTAPYQDPPVDEFGMTLSWTGAAGSGAIDDPIDVGEHLTMATLRARVDEPFVLRGRGWFAGHANPGESFRGNGEMRFGMVAQDDVRIEAASGADYVVPEPSTLVAWGGVFGLVWARRSKLRITHARSTVSS